MLLIHPAIVNRSTEKRIGVQNCHSGTVWRPREGTLDGKTKLSCFSTIWSSLSSAMYEVMNYKIQKKKNDDAIMNSIVIKFIHVKVIAATLR